MLNAERRNTPFRVWSERRMPPFAEALLEPHARLVGWGDPGDQQWAAFADVEGIVASARLSYTSTLFDRAPRLRVIARTGVGLDNIDVGEATRRSIAVCAVPDAGSASVAEHAVALMLAVAKRLDEASSAVHEGRFDIFNAFEAIELRGRVIGLVGVGRIGSRVARIVAAMEMVVRAYDPMLEPEAIRAIGAEPVPTLEDLLPQCDVVSLHAPLTQETRRLLDRTRINQMKPGAILVNTSRGGLIDEDALADALDRGWLGGAGLDVFDPEPPKADSRLLGRPNLVVSAHVASATVEARERLWRGAVTAVLAVLQGMQPANAVNAEVFVDRPS